MYEYIEIENDVFDIVFEIKRIDKDYSVKYNKLKRRFELHHNKCKPTLQLVFPYASLDYRSLLHTQKTRTDRIITELKQIDESNKNLEKKIEKNLNDELNYKAKNIFNFYNKGYMENVEYKNI